MYGISGKPQKRAFETCMGHGGSRCLQKKSHSAGNADGSGYFGFEGFEGFEDFEGSGQDFDPFWVMSSVFKPQNLPHH